MMIGDDWPANEFAPGKGSPIQKQNSKSSLALPWPAMLRPGLHEIAGYATSPDTLIGHVEWSEDEGATWNFAELTSPNEKYGWVRFHFHWLATPGRRSLMTRATDVNGVTQPHRVPFNHGGYLFNAIHSHPVVVEQEQQKGAA